MATLSLHWSLLVPVVAAIGFFGVTYLGSLAGSARGIGVRSRTIEECVYFGGACLVVVLLGLLGAWLFLSAIVVIGFLGGLVMLLLHVLFGERQFLVLAGMCAVLAGATVPVTVTVT